MPYWQKQGWRRGKSNSWLSTGIVPGSVATPAGLYLVPMDLQEPISVVQAGIRCSVGAAGATGIIVVYNVQANGEPGNLQLASVAVDLSAVTTLATPFVTSLRAPRVWAGVIVNIAGTSTTYGAGFPYAADLAQPTTAYTGGRFDATIVGAAPASVASNTFTSVSQPPRISFQQA